MSLWSFYFSLFVITIIETSCTPPQHKSICTPPHLHPSTAAPSTAAPLHRISQPVDDLQESSTTYLSKLQGISVTDKPRKYLSGWTQGEGGGCVEKGEGQHFIAYSLVDNRGVGGVVCVERVNTSFNTLTLARPNIPHLWLGAHQLMGTHVHQQGYLQLTSPHWTRWEYWD